MNPPLDNDQPSTLDHTLSTASNLLKNATRRAMVQYFAAEETDTAELDEVVDHVHEQVDDITTPDRARIALVHNHLPRLADHGVIEHDRRSETIRYRNGERLEALLKEVARNDESA